MLRFWCCNSFVYDNSHLSVEICSKFYHRGYILDKDIPLEGINEFIKNKYGVEKLITPQNLGSDAHEQIMLWGLTKVRNFND